MLRCTHSDSQLTAMGWSLNICLPEIDVDDTCVADVAVGLGAALFLGGSPVGTNAAKYSRLLCIEDTLGPRASLSRVPSISGGK